MKKFELPFKPNNAEIAKRFPLLTPEAILEIVEIYNVDEDARPNMQDICLSYGTSMTQLSRLLAEYGFKKHARYKTFHEEELLEAIKSFNITSLSELRDKLNGR